MTGVRGGGTMYCMAERTSGNPIVIIGGGLAGGNAAATLREEGFAGPVVLLGGEPGVPFGRPPLSKTYLRSEEELGAWYVRPAGWYAEHDVECRRETANAVDPGAHTVTLADGQELAYHKVLIATGGRNRRLPARAALPPDQSRMRRDQGRGREGPARGGDRHGLHRLRGGGLADPARRPGHHGFPREGTARAGPGRPGRRRDRRLPPCARRRPAARRTGHRPRGRRTSRSGRHRLRSPHRVRFRRRGPRHPARGPGRPGRPGQRDPDRRTLPGQRARRLRGR